MKNVLKKSILYALAFVMFFCTFLAINTKETSASTIASVCYRAHVINDGWQSWVSNGATAGTTGQAKQMEAICLNLQNMNCSGGITYRAHVMNDGWQSWVNNGATAGTTGQAKRMEAIQIKLTGEISYYFDVYYRAHVSGDGWQSWVKNGLTAGTTGQTKQIEAIEIKLVKKNRSALVLGETTTSPVPEKDVTSMVSMLNNNNFNGDRISVTSYQNKTKDFITSTIKNTFANSSDSDVNYIYMTCHGRADGSICIDKSNPYTGSELRTILNQVKGTVVLMLDCCYPGSIIDKSSNEFNYQKFSNDFYSKNVGGLNTNCKVICSSSKTEQSFSNGVSVATKYWELGAGWDPSSNSNTVLNADSNNDSYVTLDELYKYSVNKPSKQTIVCSPANDDFVLFSK